MTTTEACNILHIDAGTNDALVASLVEAAKDYIEVATGLSSQFIDSEPMAGTAIGFLITQWYYSDHADDQSLTRSISALLKALTLKAREHENG